MSKLKSEFDIWHCSHSFGFWVLNFDIALGWGLGIILIKIVSCFLVIL